MTDQQFLDMLREWLPRQRWFPFTATPDQLRVSVAGRAVLDSEREGDPAPGREHIMLLIRADVGDRSELLSVPVLRSPVPVPELERFLIGS